MNENIQRYIFRRYSRNGGKFTQRGSLRKVMSERMKLKCNNRRKNDRNIKMETSSLVSFYVQMLFHVTFYLCY